MPSLRDSLGDDSDFDHDRCVSMQERFQSEFEALASKMIAAGSPPREAAFALLSLAITHIKQRDASADTAAEIARATRHIEGED